MNEWTTYQGEKNGAHLNPSQVYAAIYLDLLYIGSFQNYRLRCWLVYASLTCEHALDGLLGEALGILELLDCHGFCEFDIRVDDGRAHVARAIALHPAMLCEVETIQLDAKELHPVTMRTEVTLGRRSTISKACNDAPQ